MARCVSIGQHPTNYCYRSYLQIKSLNRTKNRIESQNRSERYQRQCLKGLMHFAIGVVSGAMGYTYLSIAPGTSIINHLISDIIYKDSCYYFADRKILLVLMIQ